MTITQEQLSRIIILRGLGYNQEEIADDINVSRKTVENHLKKLKKGAVEAMSQGKFDEYYFETLLGLNTVGILKYMLRYQCSI